MLFIPQETPRSIKQILVIIGALLVLFGLLISFPFLLMYLLLVVSGQPEAIPAGVVSFIVTLLTLGTGGTLCWHASSWLQAKPSRSLSLPSPTKLVVAFGVYLVLGAIIFRSEIIAKLFLPVTLPIMAAVPPVLATAWFMNQRADVLTWRQALVIFSGSATLGLLLGGSLQLLLMLATSILFPHLTGSGIEVLLNNLEGEYASLLRDGQIGSYLFIQIAVFYPLATELVKPLILLPVLSRFSERETFLLGAIAGAGLATIETTLLAGLGFQGWVWILILQFLGCAIHPLSSGLVALGWGRLLSGKLNGWPNWLAYFGSAVALRTLWNAGFLASIVVISSRFAGYLGLGVTILFSLAGAGFLTGLGVVALWLGYSIAQAKTLKLSQRYDALGDQQPIAIWAVTSLLVILPVGILCMRLLFQ